MLKRIVTAVLLLIAAFLLIAYQGWYLRAALLLICVLAMRETFAAMKGKGMNAVRWPAYAFALFAALGQAFRAQLWFLDESPLLLALMFCVLMGIVSIIFIGKPDFEGMIATVFPILYPGLFCAFLMKLQDLNGRGVPTMALSMAVLVPSMNDTFALFVGKAFGKRKLIPEISPNKTVAGSVAGLIASVAFAIAIPLALRELDIALNGAAGAVTLAPMWVFGLFGLVCGALSQVGDLVASLIKRHCGIKDYGRLFPGHGGMMDRMDAILFGGVASYVLFMLTGH